ncbi:MAG: efflux RND transporter periplasmic adaptor subunit [Draconibacterium sp.]
MKSINKYKKYIVPATILITGILIGILIGHKSSNQNIAESANQQINESSHQHIDESTHQIWTCSMHPQIRMDEPGDCPICGMDLIPLVNADTEIDDDAIEMSESAIKLAEVQTSIVSKGAASKDIQLYGKIQVDERLKQSQTAHVPGRIDKLMVNVTGEQVKQGQLVATIYSPELVTAQKELLEALSLKDKYPSLVEAAREKLRNWKLPEEQISAIEKSGKVTTDFEIPATTSGIVANLKVNEGDYVSKGTVLFEVTNLSKVWGVFDAYESDLHWISLNQKVDFTTQSVPGKTFTGKITFIDPVIDPLKRTARVRVELDNTNQQLKPEMFINGIIHSDLKNSSNDLTIPQSAVLWTGIRSVVYVKVPGAESPTFKMREITLGAATKDTYIVVEGLQEGEEIVTNGAFSVDAAAQLAGKTSMMNPAGEKMSTGYNHDGMEMGGEAMPNSETKVERVEADPKFKAQLTAVYKNYLKMKDAFVESDPAKVGEEAKKLESAIKKVNMKLLKDDAHMAWMDQVNVLNKSIETIQSEEDIEKQRQAFSNFNNAFYKSLKMFGLANDTAYYQYCPMAFDDKGAYWFSDVEEIRNPYFGDMMLSCGETKETLK